VGKREHFAQDGTTPHVTLRQAVRPVVVAHAILSSEKPAAVALAEEAANLVELTEELLTKLGRVHLLTASAAITVDPPRTGIEDRLIGAYARAGMSWALVVGSMTRLGELLIGEADWTACVLLARFMAEVGETAVAERIERTRFGAQAAVQTHQNMTSGEIRGAISQLSSLSNLPKKASVIRSRRLHLTGSAHAIAQRRKIQGATALAAFYWNIAQYLSQNPGEEDGYSDCTLPERLFPQILATLDMCGL
jgi:hypothetical protein